MGVSNQIPVIGTPLVDLSEASGIGFSTDLGPTHDGDQTPIAFTPHLPFQYGGGSMNAPAPELGERFQGGATGVFGQKR